MNKKAFVLSATKLVQHYQKLKEEGVLSVGTQEIHMTEALFALFPKSKCTRKNRPCNHFPTEYSVEINGIKFFCITDDPQIKEG